MVVADPSAPEEPNRGKIANSRGDIIVRGEGHQAVRATRKSHHQLWMHESMGSTPIFPLFSLYFRGTSDEELSNQSRR